MPRSLIAVAERAYFLLCGALGWLLRSARYSRVWVVQPDGTLTAGSVSRVRKRRSAYAPLFISMGGVLSRILDTGVRVLAQSDWEERERLIWQTLHGTAIHVDPGGTLVLPRIAGKTLATLLDDRDLEEPIRKKAIEHAAVALAGFHHRGLTHGDAMAENVLVAGVAQWFDFETVHDSSRPMVWRRADDLRALVSTCLIRTTPGRTAETLHLILDAYADEDVTRVLATSFASVWRRSLTFHLAQAQLSFRRFREIGRLLSERAAK